VTRLVVWQQRGRIDFEREQIADGVLILRAVQPAKRVRAPGIRRGGGGQIERTFQLRHDPLVSLRIRPFVGDRRHLPMVELAQDLLPDRRIRRRIFRIQTFQRKLALPNPVVVAVEAKPSDQRFGRMRRRAAVLREAR
jgi:hypothetical protein